MKLLYLSVAIVLSSYLYSSRSYDDYEQIKRLQSENKRLEETTRVLRDEVIYFANQVEIEKKINNTLPMGSPVRKMIITSNFSYNRFHPIKHYFIKHLGIDFDANEGDLIYATGDGYAYTDSIGSYGNYIRIEHNVASYESGFESRYAHLKHFLVKDGQYVQKGEPIAIAGSTGLATGIHLHYEILKNGIKINPKIML